MSTSEWRLSGKDGCTHAFPAEDGYIKQLNMISTIPLSSQEDAAEEFFGPYEAFVSVCGHVVPVAMLMPSSDGPPCTSCAVLTDTPRSGISRWPDRPRTSGTFSMAPVVMVSRD